MAAGIPEGARLRVAVGMSGGLDSSAAAAVLVDRGYQVLGLTAHMWRDGSRCCSPEDVRRAVRVAEFLKIPHYVIDAVEFFNERIVHPFVEAYAHGRTPSPCVDCNQVIKFGLLLRDALQMGCSHIATGHYARVERRDDGVHLLRGRDEQKDQSYFLHRLFQEQLEHILFPLGEWTKGETADYAMRRGLPVRLGEESQDLCFIPEDTGYSAFLERHRPQLKRPGPIVDTAGREVGQHEGFYRYTVGQREGIGVAAAERLYVKELQPNTNTVVVGSREEVLRDRCFADDIHWILAAPADGAQVTAQLRYRHRGAAARLKLLEGSRVEVVFDEPQFAVTPGQAAVFYAGEEVLGGGWIT
mgnify:CR=1 FL=1